MAARDTQDDAARVLVVDDDAALAEMVQIVLQREGYLTYWCDNGADAVDSCTGFRPDLILLDLMLPGRNGIEVCRDIRRTSGVPIIMLTARSETADVVSGLESGADDYVSKPFKTKELVARIRARLRQPNDLAAPDVITLGGLVIDTAAHRVTRGGGGAEIMLTPWSSRSSSPWLADPMSSSAETPCSRRCGAISAAPPTPDWSTSTSSDCAPRSSWTRNTLASSSRCEAPDTEPVGKNADRWPGSLGRDVSHTSPPHAACGGRPCRCG